MPQAVPFMIAVLLAISVDLVTSAPTVLSADEASTSLFQAVENGDEELARESISAGARINDVIPGGSGQTALMKASLIGEAGIVKLLLAAGADATIGEQDGYTPLHGAGFQGRAAVARILLQDSRVPNVAHADGYYPVHRACWRPGKNFADTVQAFLDAGVSPTLQTVNGTDGPGGQTLLQIAKDRKNKDVILILEKALKAEKVKAAKSVEKSDL